MLFLYHFFFTLHLWQDATVAVQQDHNATQYKN